MTTIPAVRTIAGTEYPAAGRWTIDPGHAETVTIDTATLTSSDDTRDGHLRSARQSPVGGG